MMSERFEISLVQLQQAWKQYGRKSRGVRRNGSASGLKSNSIAALIENLESRTLLAATSIIAADVAKPSLEVVSPLATSNPTGYLPSQISAAYGFNQVSLVSGANGTGQTIAIVGAYHSPTILSDLQAFDRAFGLQDPPSLVVMSQTGSTTVFPPTDPNPNRSLGWELESALDVEWTHALAPGAKIVLVEANSTSFADLIAAVKTAANLPGVSVVSMSWGSGEFASETLFDSAFVTPPGHAGVTFVASTGDRGAPGDYPAASPNVLSVGGTTLTFTTAGARTETAWSKSGGGISVYESQPAYQKGIVTQSTSQRTLPDVAFDADPYTGVPVYATFSNGTSNPWAQIGGTSLGAPSWAAVIAIANQARSQNGLGSLDGATQTLPLLYKLNLTTPSAFHDITTGNNGYAAGVGYDLVTGMGTPTVNVLVTGLSSGTSTSSKLTILSSPTTGTAGVVLGAMTVAIQNANGQVMTTDQSTVTVSIVSGPGGFASGSTVSVAAVKGVAKFSNLFLTIAGTYVLKVSDTGLTAATSQSLTISAGQAAKVVFQRQPTTVTTGQILTPGPTVAVQDAFGNTVTTNGSQVTLSVATGPGVFTAGSTSTATAVNGIATFSNLVLVTAGSYTLKAVDASLTLATSSSFTVNGTLAAPQGVTAVAKSTTTALVSWLPSSGAQGYRVFKVTGAQSVLVGTVGSTVTSSLITALTPGSTVSFKVQAFSGTAIADSAVVSVTLLLAAPQGVAAVAKSATTALVSWLPSSGAQGYRVYQVTGTQSVLLGTVSSSATSSLITALNPGSTVSFKVQAFSGTAIADSAAVSVTLPSNVTLGTPILTIKVLTSTSVQLNWNTVAGAEGYRIYWSDGTNRYLLGTVGSGITTKTVSGLLNWATYQFQIEAFQGTNIKDSPWVTLNILASS